MQNLRSMILEHLWPEVRRPRIILGTVGQPRVRRPTPAALIRQSAS